LGETQKPCNYKGNVAYSKGFTVVVVGFWCATNGTISFCEEEL
jgi:hypothetical protein